MKGFHFDRVVPRRFGSLLFKFFAVAVGLVSIVSARAEVIRDIEYAKAGGIALTLDVNVPEGSGPFPVAILVHGGGFTNVTQRDYIWPLFAPLTDAKFTWFSIDYRGLLEGTYPAWVEDVETAIRWVKANAGKYKGDPSRVALIGESFGSYLSCLAVGRATNDTKVQALVSIYGTFADMSANRNPPEQVRRMYGITNPQDAPGILKEASVPTHLKPGWPPTLFIHGSADPKAPYRFSVEAHKRVTALGVASELVTVTNGVHGMADWELAGQHAFKTNLVKWLEKTLR